MNEEAEAWIAKWAESNEDACLLRNAMQWVYADAAKVCKNRRDHHDQRDYGAAYTSIENNACINAIEARAK